MAEKQVGQSGPEASSEEQTTNRLLRELHRLLKKRSQLREQIEQVRRSIRAREYVLEQVKQQLEQKREELKSLRKTIHEREVDRQIKEERIRELQRRLNECKNNKEYQLLLQERDAQKAALGRLEDETLELLEREDQLKAQIAELEKKLQEEETKLHEFREKQQAEVARLQAELEQLAEETRATEAQLPAEMRESYNRLVRQKDEDAIAAVEHRGDVTFICQGCYSTLPPQLGLQLFEGRWGLCSTCGRLLYLDMGTVRSGDTT